MNNTLRVGDLLVQSPFRRSSSTLTSGRSPILPVVPDRGMIDPDIDRLLSDFARAMDRSDPVSRNLLFDVYALRLERILLRLWYRNLHEFGVELDDLKQELFLIFVTLLDRWSGRGSFSAYLHGAVPWRLFDSARRLATMTEHPGESLQTIPDWHDSYIEEETLRLLEELARSLSSFDRDLLLRHIRDGEKLSSIARSKGLSPRTVRRAWVRLQWQLRRRIDLS